MVRKGLTGLFSPSPPRGEEPRGRRGARSLYSCAPPRNDGPHHCMPNIAPYGLTPAPEARKLPPVHAPSAHTDQPRFAPDSRQAWLRLALAVLIASVGAVGMWSVVVVMPVV